MTPNNNRRTPQMFLSLLIVASIIWMMILPLGSSSVQAAKTKAPDADKSASSARSDSNATVNNGPLVSTPVASDQTKQAKAGESYGKLPLSFEANQGQTDAQVKFLSRGSVYSLFLNSTEAIFSFSKADGHKNLKSKLVTHTGARDSKAQASAPATDVVRMKLVGATNATQVTGEDELPGKKNYLIGNDPAKWHTNVSTYGKVRYGSVYPGVDLIYSGNQQKLEYDFVIAPGADPNIIALAFDGPYKLQINRQGDLVLRTKGGRIVQHKPFVYQEESGVKNEIAGHYVFKGKGQVGFKLGAYDTSKPLVIDPVLAYSTYLGGSAREEGKGIAVDSGGSAYVTGSTASADFPITPNTHYRGFRTDVFVAKLNPAGTALVYATYLGGGQFTFAPDQGNAIAVDGDGNTYVTGLTWSSDFPVSAGAFQSSLADGEDAFVAKLNSDGTSLVYSTFLGGVTTNNNGDEGNGIAVDAGGNA